MTGRMASANLFSFFAYESQQITCASFSVDWMQASGTDFHSDNLLTFFCTINSEWMVCLCCAVIYVKNRTAPSSKASHGNYYGKRIPIENVLRRSNSLWFALLWNRSVRFFDERPAEGRGESVFCVLTLVCAKRVWFNDKRLSVD